MRKCAGQSLVEVLLALALFVIVVAGTSILLSRYLETQQRAQTLDRVRIIAEESAEAVTSIALNDWTALLDGTYGLSSLTGHWTFAADPNVLDNTFTRSLEISPVNRDENCAIVESGGTPDPDTKRLDVTVSWQQLGSVMQQTAFQYLTRWGGPTNCITQKDSASFVLDVSGARIDSTKKSLTGVEMRNTGSKPITLDKFQLTWTKPGNITIIKIEGQDYWNSNNGTGTPQGSQPSGTELDLENFVMAPGDDEEYEVNYFRFDSKVDGSTFVITATLTDGSLVTVTTTPPFIP